MDPPRSAAPAPPSRGEVRTGEPVPPDPRTWRQDLEHGQRRPYPPSVYLLRGLWRLVQSTVWRILPSRFPPRRAILLRWFGADIRGIVLILPSVRVEMPWALSIGEFCTLGSRVILYNLGGLEIGHHTVLSQDVYVCGGTHDYTQPTFPLLRRKITIGHHVWIGAGAFIGPGVTIGDGAVVGARAVVVKDVPPWTVVAGNPARVVKQRMMSGEGEAEGMNVKTP